MSEYGHNRIPYLVRSFTAHRRRLLTQRVRLKEAYQLLAQTEHADLLIPELRAADTELRVTEAVLRALRPDYQSRQRALPSSEVETGLSPVPPGEEVLRVTPATPHRGTADRVRRGELDVRHVSAEPSPLGDLTV